MFHLEIFSHSFSKFSTPGIAAGNKKTEVKNRHSLCFEGAPNLARKTAGLLCTVV